MHRKIRSFTESRTFYNQLFFLNNKCYYIRCKYNKQTTIGSQKICYYKRIVTIYDVTISGLKCITEIGKLQGPSIYCYYMRIVTISGVTIYGLHCTASWHNQQQQHVLALISSFLHWLQVVLLVGAAPFVWCIPSEGVQGQSSSS